MGQWLWGNGGRKFVRLPICGAKWQKCGRFVAEFGYDGVGSLILSRIG